MRYNYLTSKILIKLGACPARRARGRQQVGSLCGYKFFKLENGKADFLIVFLLYLLVCRDVSDALLFCLICLWRRIPLRFSG